MGILDTLFGGEAEANAAQKNRDAAAQYGTQAQGDLTTGYNTGQTNLNQAVGAYQPLSDLGAKYTPAIDMYLNSLGVNGPQGNAAATSAFQNDPGTTGAINAGLDVMNRRRVGQGMGASGNADIDALTFGQNLQNQQFQNWQNQLSGAGNTGIGLVGAAAQGQAGGYTNLSNLAQQYAQNQVGVSGNVLGADTSANTLEAQGKAAGAKNLLGAGLSLASLAMAPMTGGASLMGMGGTALKNMNLGQNFFGGGSPTGYGRA
jgi:hypothetical protein